MSHGEKRLASLRRRNADPFTQIGITIVSLGIATGLSLFFRSVGITESSIVLVYLLSVVIAAVMTGRLFGIAASLVAVVLFNFLFTEPRFTFVVYDPQYLVTFPVMLTVAVISSELTARIRKQAEEARRRELSTKLLYESSRSLLGAQGQAEVIRAGVRHLSGLIERPIVCAVDDGQGAPLFVDDGDSQSVDDLVAPIRRMLGQQGASQSVSVEVGSRLWKLVPVRAQGQTLAVIAIMTGSSGLSMVASESMRAVVVQLALALDREEIGRREQNARIEIERERLRANLLQSISHDLRSPLAAIVGSASALVEQAGMAAETRTDLVRSIRDDARWLAGLVENLLSLTRAEESAVRLRGSVEVVDDVLSSALGRISRIHETHNLRVDPGDEPVLMHMDSGLIEQLIINLLENAIQHTPPGSTVRVGVQRERDMVVLAVEDDGPGLSTRALEHAFERFYTERSIPDGRRGLGLGLSICRSIAEAHGGAITAANLPRGGARLEVRLPAPKELIERTMELQE